MSKEKERMRLLSGIPMLKEGQEVETVNTAKKGDYIVKNPTGEEYVLTPSEFKKNYFMTPIGKEDSNGYLEYNNRPEKRDVVEVSKSIMNDINKKFNSTPSQEEFFNFAKELEIKKAEKSVTVKARVSDKEEKIVTVTKKEDDKDVFKFKASWDEDMILKDGDFLVVSSDEVYRIGKKEFENTYKYSD